MHELEKKIKKATDLLFEASEDWNEDDLISYPPELPSFDYLVTLINEIQFKEENGE